MTEIGMGVRDEHHEVPETSLDERTHQLDAYCWCRPEVVRIERSHGGALRSVQIVHRSPMPADVTPSDPVPVLT